MTRTDDDSPDGKWVHVVSGGSDAYTGSPTSEFGVLEARDAGFLYIRRADGGMAILPISAVRSVRVIEPPAPIPGGTLLRAASVDDLLVTPAAPTRGDPATLLTPSSPPGGPMPAPGRLPWWMRLLRLIVRWWRQRSTDR